MISKKSFLNFLFINTFFLSYGFFEYIYFFYFNFIFFNSFLEKLLFIYIFRNTFLYIFLEIATKKYNYINKNIINNNNFELKYFIQASLFDTFNQYFLLHILFLHNNNNSLFHYNDLFLFIFKSFFIEIIFDFFHYLFHYIEHKNKFLYNNFHKIHHNHHSPTFITTYHHHIGDLILTNTIPLFLALYISKQFFNISSYLFFVLYISKVYLELCGHSGKDNKKSGSFVQFIWLPQFLNIELYTNDHYNHHKYNNCNYSKRFSLYDKIFNTYKKDD